MKEEVEEHSNLEMESLKKMSNCGVNLKNCSDMIWQDANFCSNCYSSLSPNSKNCESSMGFKDELFCGGGDNYFGESTTIIPGFPYNVTLIEALNTVFDIYKNSHRTNILLDENRYSLCKSCSETFIKLFTAFYKFSQASINPSFLHSLIRLKFLNNNNFTTRGVREEMPIQIKEEVFDSDGDEEEDEYIPHDLPDDILDDPMEALSIEMESDGELDGAGANNNEELSQNHRRLSTRRRFPVKYAEHENLTCSSSGPSSDDDDDDDEMYQDPKSGTSLSTLQSHNKDPNVFSGFLEDSNNNSNNNNNQEAKKDISLTNSKTSSKKIIGGQKKMNLPRTRKSKDRPRPHKYICVECNIGFNRSNHLRTHQNTHSSDPAEGCRCICGASFNGERNLRYHQRHYCRLIDSRADLNSTNTVQVEVEEASDSQSLSLQQQQVEPTSLSKRSTATESTAGIITATTKTSSGGLLVRKKIRKDETGSYHCNYIQCGKALSTRRLYDAHLEMHVRKPHLCGYCRRCYASEDELSRHVQRLCSAKPEDGNVSTGGDTTTSTNPILTTMPTITGNGRQLKRQKIFKTRLYACYCGEIFKRTNHLRAHLPVHSPKNFPCPHCSAGFANQSRLQKHVMIHDVSAVRPDPATIRGTFNEDGILIPNPLYGIRKKKKKPNPKLVVECEICKTEVAKKSLKDHMKIHDGVVEESVVVVESSNISNNDNNNSNNDNNNSNNGESSSTVQNPGGKGSVVRPPRTGIPVTKKFKYRLYACYCGETFKRTNHIRAHFPVHTPNNFQCPHCPAGFNNHARLEKHLKIHDPLRVPPNPATIRGTFNEQGILIQNPTYDLRRKANKKLSPQLIECEICKKLVRKQTLKNHMLVTHVDSRPVVCELCGLGVKTVHTLKSHQKYAHTGERPFLCNICGKTFKRNQHLENHEKVVHSESRSFKCDACKKSFKSQRNLRQHIFVHEGGRYSCKKCDSVFTRKDNLKVHMDRICLGSSTSTKNKFQEDDLDHQRAERLNSSSSFYSSSELNQTNHDQESESDDNCETETADDIVSVENSLLITSRNQLVEDQDQQEPDSTSSEDPAADDGEIRNQKSRSYFKPELVRIKEDPAATATNNRFPFESSFEEEEDQEVMEQQS